MKKVNLEVKGMYCAHCSKAVENALEKAGVFSHVDLAHNRVEFSYDETTISLDYLRRLVKRAGYELVIDDSKKFNINKILVPVSLIVLVFSLLGILYHVVMDSAFLFFFGNDVTFLIVATIALLVLGTPFIVRAGKGILFKNVGMDFLIALSSVASYVLSLYIFITNIQNGIDPLSLHSHSIEGYRMTYFDGTCMILSVITLGHLLTDRIKTKADKNYRKAAIEPPKFATLLYPDGTTESVDSDSLDVGNVFRVLSGEQIACDGTILSGEGLVDESSLTGESRPRKIGPGEMVMGGTVLVSGPIDVKVDKIALDSLYSSIINESYALDQKKGKLSKLSDKIAGLFTPAIVLIALAAFFICLFGMGLDVEESIVRACSVLSVSCPCAFGLAVPISALSGYDCALSRGVLFKSGDTFEKVRQIKAAVFDKTGTLSTGKMEVLKVAGDKTYLPLVKAMEEHSAHPIALSLVSYLKDVPAEKEADIREIPGQGLVSNGFFLGNAKSAEGKKRNDEIAALEQDSANSTIVYLSDDEKVILAFSLHDELVPDSVETIARLKEEGIESYMLTGDRKEYAYAIARSLGIPEKNVRYELAPSDKAAILREIREQDGVISYVGDGINDTLALKESDLSFASYKASAVACTSADGLLLKPGLYILVYALRISRKTYLNIVENFIWAICYNLAMIPLAILGILPMYLCGALMILSNLTLTINSVRIRRYKPEKEDEKHDRNPSR
ncbi:MAG TPA: cation-translocating P-type ATPase [Candidatus Enterosoma merdigallinarum]|nr:cation-translocating P-type ATPase [Candidatus Enterosoma merdigallinarum]